MASEASGKHTIEGLIRNNRAWAEQVERDHPGFFRKLALQQNPELLWIGCSDSRVSADRIVGLMPGEVFVHRNVANQVMHVDFNCLAVVQYAIEALRVSRIIVCGHYGCGGIQASFQQSDLGLIDNWLYSVDALREKHRAELESLPGNPQRIDALCEINVIEQVRNVCHTSMVQRAWRRGQVLSVHGLIYGVHDGHIHDLGVTVTGVADVDQAYEMALKAPRLLHHPHS